MDIALNVVLSALGVLVIFAIITVCKDIFSAERQSELDDGDIRCVKDSLQIQGSNHVLLANISTGYVQIGCQNHHIDDWLEHFESIGRETKYTEEQLDEYEEYLAFIKLRKERLNPTKFAIQTSTRDYLATGTNKNLAVLTPNIQESLQFNSKEAAWEICRKYNLTRTNIVRV